MKNSTYYALIMIVFISINFFILIFTMKEPDENLHVSGEFEDHSSRTRDPEQAKKDAIAQAFEKLRKREAAKGDAPDNGDTGRLNDAQKCAFLGRTR